MRSSSRALPSVEGALKGFAKGRAGSDQLANSKNVRRDQLSPSKAMLLFYGLPLAVLLWYAGAIFLPPTVRQNAPVLLWTPGMLVLANEAGESLDAITASATKSSERSREIVQAVREQSKAAAHVAAMMDTVNEGLGAIRRATEEQTRGHETVADGTRRMSEVSRQLATTTEEQARGVKRIGESAEGVREASEAIHALVESQTAACATSAELLQQLAGQTAISEEGVSQMEEAIRELVRDSQTLRTDVARFRL